jgi:hypothetical protein
MLAAGGVGMAGLATAAGACCVPVIAPTVVAVLGAGGSAWAAGLGPWSPWILMTAGACIGLAHWRLRRPAVGVSSGPEAEGGACSPRVPGAVTLAVWGATLVWLTALAIQLWAAAAASGP